MVLSKNKIEIILARKKMSRTQMAKTAGVSRNRIYVILKSRNVTPAVVGRIAEALDVDVTEILEEESR